MKHRQTCRSCCSSPWSERRCRRAALAVGPNQERDGRSLYDDRTTPRNLEPHRGAARGPRGRGRPPAQGARHQGPGGVRPRDGHAAQRRQARRLPHRAVAGGRRGRRARLREGAPEPVRARARGRRPEAGQGLHATSSAPRTSCGRRSSTASRRSTTASAPPSPRTAGCCRSAAPRCRRLSIGTTPKLTAAQALQAALARRRRQGRPPARSRRRAPARARSTEFKGDNQAKLAIYTSFGGPRLVWRVLADKSSTQLYDYTIDASTGEVLHRENTVEFATGLAWDYFPGPIPFNNSGTATSRDFTANGWLALQRDDALGQQRPHLLRPARRQHAGGGRRGPAEQRQQLELRAVALQRRQLLRQLLDQLPVLVGLVRREQLADEHAPERDADLLLRQQLPRLPEEHRADRASPRRRATSRSRTRPGRARAATPSRRRCSTAPTPTAASRTTTTSTTPTWARRADGLPPRMQMYLMSGMGPNGGDVNSGDDASVIYHEYTHGLSSRLVTDNDGNPALGAQQSGSMGEGWSDWYAMDFLVNHGYDAGQRRDRRRQHGVLRRRRRRLPHASRSTARSARATTTASTSTAPATAATPTTTSPRSPAAPRCTPTARSGTRPCGSCASAWSPSTARSPATRASRPTSRAAWSSRRRSRR